MSLPYGFMVLQGAIWFQLIVAMVIQVVARVLLWQLITDKNSQKIERFQVSFISVPQMVQDKGMLYGVLDGSYNNAGSQIWPRLGSFLPVLSSTRWKLYCMFNNFYNLMTKSFNLTSLFIVQMVETTLYKATVIVMLAC